MVAKIQLELQRPEKKKKNVNINEYFNVFNFNRITVICINRVPLKIIFRITFAPRNFKTYLQNAQGDGYPNKIITLNFPLKLA